MPEKPSGLAGGVVTALPLLTICGGRDELVSLETVMEMHQSLGSSDKTLEVIPRAGHNDLWQVGLEQYFASVRRFLSERVARDESEVLGGWMRWPQAR